MCSSLGLGRVVSPPKNKLVILSEAKDLNRYLMLIVSSRVFRGAARTSAQVSAGSPASSR